MRGKRSTREEMAEIEEALKNEKPKDKEKVPRGYELYYDEEGEPHLRYETIESDRCMVYSRYSKKHVLVHRAIWENYYKQVIPEGHCIHHINGDHEDNRIENLQLMTNKEHLRHHHKGKKNSEETKKKMSESKMGEKNPQYGKKLSPEHNAALHAKDWTGRKHTEESREKMRHPHKQAPLITCPHCGKQGRGPSMVMYHGDNCKNKIS